MHDSNVIGVQIPANEAYSGEVNIGNHELVAFEMPESWSGTTITFQSKAKKTYDQSGVEGLEDWDNLYDSSGNEVSVTVAANRVVALVGNLRDAFAALGRFRIRSGTSAAPFAQNPTREILVIVK